MALEVEENPLGELDKRWSNIMANLLQWMFLPPYAVMV